MFETLISTAKVEYIVAWFARCEAVWLQKLFAELFDQVQKTTIMISRSTLRTNTVTWYRREQCGSSIILQMSKLRTKPLSQAKAYILRGQAWSG